MDLPDDSSGLTITERLSRAEMFYDLDRYDDARDELAAALRIGPANIDALTLLAVVELAAEEYDDALAAAGAALAVDPGHQRALIARGYALAGLERTSEAMQAAERLLDADRESWLLNVHYALIVRRSRNGQSALDAAWYAVQAAPDEPRAHTALALVARDLGLSDLADRALTAARELDPKGTVGRDRMSPPVRWDVGGAPDRPRRRDRDAESPKRETDIEATKSYRNARADLYTIALQYGGGALLIPAAWSLVTGNTPGTAQIVIAGLGGAALFAGRMLKRDRDDR